MIDNQSLVNVVYTDFAKTVDRIDHGILLKKLIAFGFSDQLITLFSVPLIIEPYSIFCVQWIQIQKVSGIFRYAPRYLPGGFIISDNS